MTRARGQNALAAQVVNTSARKGMPDAAPGQRVMLQFGNASSASHPRGGRCDGDVTAAAKLCSVSGGGQLQQLHRRTLTRGRALPVTRDFPEYDA